MRDGVLQWGSGIKTDEVAPADAAATTTTTTTTSTSTTTATAVPLVAGSTRR